MRRSALFVSLIALTTTGCMAINPKGYHSNLIGSPPPTNLDANQSQPPVNQSTVSNRSNQTQSKKVNADVEPAQPGARVLVCAVTTSDALKKDHSRKPEHCRIFDVKTVEEAFHFKCDRVFAISRLFKDGNYSCDVTYLKCLPGTSCEFADFPCNNSAGGSCNGVKRISLVTPTSRSRPVDR
ncbi:MAG: hypothetical protein K6T90_21210 [Leptolyngbyaceae cyanobacterium HOT.MB2.61]|nr:hypothetical protein [Leptolyngbyaceae cyanobacterium HOT.MB2.61]